MCVSKMSSSISQCFLGGKTLFHTAKNGGKKICPFLENEDFFLKMTIFFSQIIRQFEKKNAHFEKKNPHF